MADQPAQPRSAGTLIVQALIGVCVGAGMLYWAYVASVDTAKARDASPGTHQSEALGAYRLKSGYPMARTAKDLALAVECTSHKDRVALVALENEHRLWPSAGGTIVHILESHPMDGTRRIRCQGGIEDRWVPFEAVSLDKD